MYTVLVNFLSECGNVSICNNWSQNTADEELVLVLVKLIKA